MAWDEGTYRIAFLNQNPSDTLEQTGDDPPFLGNLWSKEL